MLSKGMRKIYDSTKPKWFANFLQNMYDFFFLETVIHLFPSQRIVSDLHKVYSKYFRHVIT